MAIIPSRERGDEPPPPDMTSPALAKPRRIVFLVSSMEAGGAERVAAILANYWAENGHHVTLMQTFSGKAACQYQLDSRVHLDALTNHTTAPAGAFRRSVHRLLLLRRILADLTPDVVVSFLTNVNVAAILASSFRKFPVLVSERIHPAAHSPGRGWELARLLTYWRADYVVAQTETSKHWFEEHCPGSRPVVIPNPVNWPLPGQDGTASYVHLRESRKILLGVGRLELQKGFDRLIDAFSRIMQDAPEWDLVIVGEGSQRAVLEAARKRSGCPERIHLPGKMQNMAAWYERANIYTLSSRYEGFPNSLLEAMSYGLPVVSTDCITGPGDLIRNEVNGMLVPEDCTPTVFGDALLSLMLDEDKRSRLGAQASKVREHYSVPKIGMMWDQLIERAEHARRSA